MNVILLIAVAALVVGWSPGLTLVEVAVALLLLERWTPWWRTELG